MKRYFRLALIAIFGVGLMCLLTVGLYALRNFVQARGYDVSPVFFIVAFFVVVGGAYGLIAKLVMREVRNLKTDIAQTSTPSD